MPQLRHFWRKPVKIKSALLLLLGPAALWLGLSSWSKTESYSSSSDNNDGTLATQLALRSQSLLSEDPAALEVSALLATESVMRLPSADGDYALRSALALLRKPFRTVRHSKAINSVALSSDGLWVATASDDNTARLVAVSTGMRLATLNHDHRVTRVAFSPDKNLLATASGDTVGLYDIRGRTELPRLRVGGTIISLAFSQNSQKSQLLAVGSTDNVAEVFDADTGTKIARFGRKEQLRSVALDSQARLLATAAGNVVQISNVASKTDLFPLKHEGLVRMMAFSPVEPLIATASEDGAVLLSSTKTGAKFARLNHSAPVNMVAFSEDGKLLATASADNIAHVFRVAAECKELSRFTHQGPITSIAFATDRIVITGSADHTARLFEATTGREIARLVHPGPVASVAGNRLSATVVTASEQIARLLQVTRGHDAISLGGGMKVGNAAFSANGGLVISEGRNIRIFSAVNGGQVADGPNADYPITGLTYSADGRFIAMTKQNLATQITEIFDGETVRRIALSSDLDQKSVTAMAFSADNERLAIVGDSTRSPGDEQAYLRLFAPSLAKQTGSTIGCPGAARAVALSPDHQVVAVGTSERTCIFDFGHGTTFVRLDREQTNAIAFSPHGHLVAMGTQNGSVHVFDSAGRRVFSSEKHESAVTAVLFAEDNRTLSSRTAGGVVRVFDVVRQVQIDRFPAANIKAFVFVQGQLKTLAEDADGANLQTHPLAPEDLIRQACSIMTRNLLRADWDIYMGAVTYRETCPGAHLP